MTVYICIYKDKIKNIHLYIYIYIYVLNIYIYLSLYIYREICLSHMCCCERRHRRGRGGRGGHRGEELALERGWGAVVERCLIHISPSTRD